MAKSNVSGEMLRADDWFRQLGQARPASASVTGGSSARTTRTVACASVGARTPDPLLANTRCALSGEEDTCPDENAVLTVSTGGAAGDVPEHNPERA